MVGRLQRVDLRQVWAKEAKDFTTYLADHLDILSDFLGFNLSLVETEKRIGSLSIDILAEGPTGETVIIENQLEKTNHDHLGKLVTYLANIEAKKAIWIASDPRPEHKKAINWLNENTPRDATFFLIKISAYKIGDSEPAPFFDTICEPSSEAKEIAREKGEFAERHFKRLDFWTELLEKARGKTNLHSNVSPTKDNWSTAGAGKAGMGWSYSITMNKGSVELYIDRGPDKKDETDKIYNKILNDRERIENQFGEPLIWDKVEGRRVCRIKSICNIGGLKNEDLWNQIQEDLIDRMIRLEKALKPSLSKIK